MATDVEASLAMRVPQRGFMADQGYFVRYAIVLAIFILVGFAQFAMRGFSNCLRCSAARPSPRRTDGRAGWVSSSPRTCWSIAGNWQSIASSAGRRWRWCRSSLQSGLRSLWRRSAPIANRHSLPSHSSLHSTCLGGAYIRRNGRLGSSCSAARFSGIAA